MAGGRGLMAGGNRGLRKHPQNGPALRDDRDDGQRGCA